MLNNEISILEEILSQKMLSDEVSRAGCQRIRWLELAGIIHHCKIRPGATRDVEHGF